MADIFVSYSSADRTRAQLLADLLAEKGWTVWWDRTIPPGKVFDEVIEKALDSAKCVVVLWTHTSVASSWVKTEAAEAMRREILVPALLEEVKLPLEFRRLQAADLTQWQGDRADSRLAQFFDSIGAIVSRPDDWKTIAPYRPQPPKPAPRPEPSPQPAPKPQPLTDNGLDSSVLKPKPKSVPWVIGGGVAVFVLIAMYSAYDADDDAPAINPAPPLVNPLVVPQAPPPQRVAAAKSLNLEWHDHALRYTGSLNWAKGSPTLRATVYDLKTGAQIGNYDVPARISQQDASAYIVLADFAIPGDSASPYPHSHTVQLQLQVQRDGTMRFIQNCPRPGECYAGR